MCVIRVGGEEAESLTLTAHGRAHPDAADYWDGNWLSCTAETRAGAFRGSLDGLLRNEDLARLLAGMEQLHQRLVGEAMLDTLEGWVELRLVGDGRGHVEGSGHLCDAPVHGNTLAFRLSLDQSFLPAIMAQLRAAIKRFPVVGQTPNGI